MHQETLRGTKEYKMLVFGLGLATRKSPGKGKNRVGNEEGNVRGTIGVGLH